MRSLLAVETLIFGRAAMGEDVRRGVCRDAWRVRRDGKLVFADTFRARWRRSPAALDRPAVARWRARGRHAALVAPDAAARLEQARALLEGAGSTAGASAWNGLLVVRAMRRATAARCSGDLAPLARMAERPAAAARVAVLRE